ncbi:MAG: methylated-DNA--[protein]-cysteine S-methyltransferase [Peptococcaceae bacterium]
MRYYTELPTMAGLLRIVEENDAIVQIQFEQEQKTVGDAALQDTPLLLEAKRQLEEYFAGLRAGFSLPLNPQGTAFQKKVWQQLEAIPYGQTRTYGQIAAAVGQPTASRAVGGANHNNPIAIVIPCHRVIGANGKLTGYAGGLDIKEKLLRLEGVEV